MISLVHVEFASISLVHYIIFSDEEELQLQNQIFDFVKTLQVLNLTECEIALFSATLLVRPGKAFICLLKSLSGHF